MLGEWQDGHLAVLAILVLLDRETVRAACACWGAVWRGLVVPRVVAWPRVTGLLVAGLLEACGIMGRELTQLDGARLEEGALWASYSLVVWMSWPRMRWG